MLEQLLSEFSAQELSELDPDERYEKIRGYLDSYLERFLDRSQRSKRFLYLYERLARSIDAVAARLADEFKTANSARSISNLIYRIMAR